MLCQQEGGGLPRKPLPRKKIPADLRSLARGHTELCIKVLAGIVSQEAVPPAARVSAAGILLDRGWGRAPQPHTGEDDKDIRITIRDVIAERRQEMAGGPFTALRGSRPPAEKQAQPQKSPRQEPEE